MIHFLTIHYRSDRWIDIQLRRIAQHTQEPYKLWGCLNEIDKAHHAKFHEVFDIDGEHPEKLNVMADRVVEHADPADIVVFIDGDAFPIDDLERIEPLIAEHKLVAAQRLENLGDPQPHPCFAATTVGFWKEIAGDWTRRGPAWTNTAGVTRRDAGGKVLARLKELGVDWFPLVRTNRRELHPVLFAVYGDLVYHHGAGFRSAGTVVDKYLAGGYRWQSPPMSWIAERRHQRFKRRNLKLSEEVFEEIRRDDRFIERFFLRSEDTEGPV